MQPQSKLKAAIVGLGRGQGFVSPLLEFPQSELTAMCDINPDALETIRRRFSVPDSTQRFTDYEEMLTRTSPDVVFVASPIQFHLKHAEMALSRGMTVIGEVPAVKTIDEAKRLVELCKTYKSSFMMAENANYFKFNLIVREMVRAGLFGELYYAEAEYLHELKDLILRKTPWRYEVLWGREGVTYGTHSTGPVMWWMEDDRICSVSCRGSGHHWLKNDGTQMVADDTYVMMCKTEKGRLIKIRMDFMSPRPGINRYQLQGTKGAFESKYHNEDFNKVALLPESERWRDISEFEAEYFPGMFRSAEAAASQHGHDGADYFMVLDIIDSLYEGRGLPLDVHRSLDLTLPGLCSEASANKDGAWVDVPDSRTW